MKRTFIPIILLFLLCSFNLSAQTFTINGEVKSSSRNGVANASVALKGTSYATICDSSGNYHLNNLKPGNYVLQVSAVGYQSAVKGLQITKNLRVNVSLELLVQQLNDVSVNAQKYNTFGITRLKAVEGTTINAGKKSEVVVMDDIVANKAANTTRQIYSKIAGLNIWESDGAGIQLGIGGRGLNPNRITNFNTRQNGYDIAADALGYPESYYTPPAELVDRIEILRGASSLQYGTQFGGLVNFKLNDGITNKPFEFTSRETVGSWGFLNETNSIGGTDGKVQYYAFYQHKSGDDWRPNANFNVNTAYTSITYNATSKFSIGFQYTHMDYLAHQPGGLTDAEFAADPQQSVRSRNWFKVDWNLGAVLLNYKINDNLKFNSRFFGLLADRDATGDLTDLISRPDLGGDRNLFKDKYTNYGNESRLLYSYKIGEQAQNLLVGVRYYKGLTNRQQGFGNDGSTGNNSDFNYGNSATDVNGYSKYNFPNYNVALFAENIFHITSKFSIIPGVRFENIVTKADGSYRIVNTDGAGNVIFDQLVSDVKNSDRHFVIGGLGLSYYQSEAMQFYGNISQNYRAINFSDLYSVVKTTVVDPNLKDETGYSADLGVRGNISAIFNYDVSVFDIYYNNRIGTYLSSDANNNAFQYRTNIGASQNLGLETFAELELLHLLGMDTKKTSLSVFSNLALINARYVHTLNSAFDNKKVELAPDVIFKTGLSYKYKKLSTSYQVAYTSSQFSDATNAVFTPSAVDGIVPAYTVMDFSASYKLSKIFSLEGSINNLANTKYFTRRADSYPGPGIIPADARSYFLTLQVKL
ncbi:TonB-dependent receptor [Mucilaginibacter sp. L196]|uniref:TonB-dependent receptor n=1 Tax=Mucilaginibacter sp. L196 TaxID=1641870 RepID=UPI00131D09B8|nr:TonB-dependent receptor [Mucilaginibacter sp. L196]